MDTVQIICSLKNAKSFLGVYPSDLLLHSIHQQTGTVILNTDPHTQEGTPWIAIHFQPKPPRHSFSICTGNNPVRPQYSHVPKTQLYYLEL